MATDDRLIQMRFDSHGMGDVIHAIIALQLYRNRGYTVEVAIEENKRWLWEAAGITIQNESNFPPHGYPYSPGLREFFDLDLHDYIGNKVCGFFDPAFLPKIAPKPHVWQELQEVDLSEQMRAAIPQEAHREALAFLDGLPYPIVCLHTKGTNWQEKKSIPDPVAWELLQGLIAAGASVVVLDYDARVPTISGHPQVRNIKPAWGHIGLDRLAALLTRVTLLVGVDSGPFHLASMLRVPALGVFREIPPVRCCIPAPTSSYMVRESPQWERREGEWDFITYAEREPTAEDILKAIDIVTTRQDPHMYAGRYLYRRVGYDQRPMTLADNGLITEGAGGCENHWACIHDADDEPIIRITGQHGAICDLTLDGDIWRGKWNQFEKMAIELIPINEGSPEPKKFGATLPIPYQPNSFDYVTLDRFAHDVAAYARTLPLVRAVAGIPRAGVLAASLIAMELNCPMVDIRDLEGEGGALIIPRVRREGNKAERQHSDGILLVVDDSYCSGKQMADARRKLRPNVKTGSVYVGENPDLDFPGIQEDQTIRRSYEWTLFHDDNTLWTITDMDGVLCHDWTGGNEDENAAAYVDFILNVQPLRIPSRKVLAIVTNRLSKFRKATVAWLERHGIEYGDLIMSPYETHRERDQASDAARRKAAEYEARPNARLFVESDRTQAAIIRELTGRPVLSIQGNSLV